MEDQALCAECKGACCKAMPGGAWPEDFPEPLKASLIGAITTGNWCLDYWEGTDQEYFVRVATKNRRFVVVDPSWGGICCLLTPTGCSLTHDNRPMQCRALTPVSGFQCRMDDTYSKRACVEAWLPHQTMLKEIILHFGQENHATRR